MSALLNLLEYAVAVAYVALGLLAFLEWTRLRDRAHAYLALALGSLGIVAFLGRLQPVLPPTPISRDVIGDITVALFIATGYYVLRFRGAFIPLSRPAHIAALVACIGVGIAVIAAIDAFPTDPGRTSPVVTATGLALVAVWTLCVGEPIIRFWVHARGRPRVQRSRLRALSLGFAGIVAILVVSVVAGNAVRNSELQVAIQLVALAVVPLLYSSFSPPTWLRRTWREREEAQYRTAIQALLLFSPTREALAMRGVEWATRLVGAEHAVIIDGDDSILARHNITETGVERLRGMLPDGAGTQVTQLPVQPARTAASLDLPTSRGMGKLIVVSGPFTPVFGTDEIARLEDYSSAVTAGLDRAGLTERIAALERTKTQFLNLASHELRGPVTVLRGYLSMFQRGTLPPEQVRGILPVLVAKTEEMNLLVEQMLEASRLEEGRLELRRRRVDLRDVVARSVTMMRPLADEEHPLTIIAPEQPVNVEVDPDRIGIVLNNLLDNAIKYSPEGGEVRCEVARNGTMALVSVSDRGIGISESQLPQLFTRFGRIVTSETSSIRGTGLGLYLARELTRMHGGDVTVDSTPGQGSTFVMTVPLAA